MDAGENDPTRGRQARARIGRAGPLFSSSSGSSDGEATSPENAPGNIKFPPTLLDHYYVRNPACEINTVMDLPITDLQRVPIAVLPSPGSASKRPGSVTPSSVATSAARNLGMDPGMSSPVGSSAATGGSQSHLIDLRFQAPVTVEVSPTSTTSTIRSRLPPPPGYLSNSCYLLGCSPVVAVSGGARRVGRSPADRSSRRRTTSPTRSYAAPRHPAIPSPSNSTASMPYKYYREPRQQELSPCDGAPAAATSRSPMVRFTGEVTGQRAAACGGMPETAEQLAQRMQQVQQQFFRQQHLQQRSDRLGQPPKSWQQQQQHSSAHLPPVGRCAAEDVAVRDWAVKTASDQSELIHRRARSDSSGFNASSPPLDLNRPMGHPVIPPPQAPAGAHEPFCLQEQLLQPGSWRSFAKHACAAIVASDGADGDGPSGMTAGAAAAAALGSSSGAALVGSPSPIRAPSLAIPKSLRQLRALREASAPAISRADAGEGHRPQSPSPQQLRGAQPQDAGGYPSPMSSPRRCLASDLRRGSLDPTTSELEGIFAAAGNDGSAGGSPSARSTDDGASVRSGVGVGLRVGSQTGLYDITTILRQDGSVETVLHINARGRCDLSCLCCAGGGACCTLRSASRGPPAGLSSSRCHREHSPAGVGRAIGRDTPSASPVRTSLSPLLDVLAAAGVDGSSVVPGSSISELAAAAGVSIGASSSSSSSPLRKSFETDGGCLNATVEPAGGDGLSPIYGGVHFAPEVEPEANLLLLGDGGDSSLDQQQWQARESSRTAAQDRSLVSNPLFRPCDHGGNTLDNTASGAADEGDVDEGDLYSLPLPSPASLQQMHAAAAAAATLNFPDSCSNCSGLLSPSRLLSGAGSEGGLGGPTSSTGSGGAGLSPFECSPRRRSPTAEGMKVLDLTCLQQHRQEQQRCCALYTVDDGFPHGQAAATAAQAAEAAAVNESAAALLDAAGQLCASDVPGAASKAGEVALCEVPTLSFCTPDLAVTAFAEAAEESLPARTPFPPSDVVLAPAPSSAVAATQPLSAAALAPLTALGADSDDLSAARRLFGSDIFSDMPLATAPLGNFAAAVPPLPVPVALLTDAAGAPEFADLSSFPAVFTGLGGGTVTWRSLRSSSGASSSRSGGGGAELEETLMVVDGDVPLPVTHLPPPVIQAAVTEVQQRGADMMAAGLRISRQGDELLQEAQQARRCSDEMLAEAEEARRASRALLAEAVSVKMRGVDLVAAARRVQLQGAHLMVVAARGAEQVEQQQQQEKEEDDDEEGKAQGYEAGSREVAVDHPSRLALIDRDDGDNFSSPPRALQAGAWAPPQPPVAAAAFISLPGELASGYGHDDDHGGSSGWKVRLPAAQDAKVAALAAELPSVEVGLVRAAPAEVGEEAGEERQGGGMWHGWAALEAMAAGAGVGGEITPDEDAQQEEAEERCPLEHGEQEEQTEPQNQEQQQQPAAMPSGTEFTKLLAAPATLAALDAGEQQQEGAAAATAISDAIFTAAPAAVHSKTTAVEEQTATAAAVNFPPRRVGSANGSGEVGPGEESAGPLSAAEWDELMVLALEVSSEAMGRKAAETMRATAGEEDALEGVALATASPLPPPPPPQTVPPAKASRVRDERSLRSFEGEGAEAVQAPAAATAEPTTGTPTAASRGALMSVWDVDVSDAGTAMLRLQTRQRQRLREGEATAATDGSTVATVAGGDKSDSESRSCSPKGAEASEVAAGVATGSVTAPSALEEEEELPTGGSPRASALPGRLYSQVAATASFGMSATAILDSSAAAALGGVLVAAAPAADASRTTAPPTPPKHATSTGSSRCSDFGHSTGGPAPSSKLAVAPEAAAAAIPTNGTTPPSSSSSWRSVRAKAKVKALAAAFAATQALTAAVATAAPGPAPVPAPDDTGSTVGPPGARGLRRRHVSASGATTTDVSTASVLSVSGATSASDPHGQVPSPPLTSSVQMANGGFSGSALARPPAPGSRRQRSKKQLQQQHRPGAAVKALMCLPVAGAGANSTTTAEEATPGAGVAPRNASPVSPSEAASIETDAAIRGTASDDDDAADGQSSGGRAVCWRTFGAGLLASAALLCASALHLSVEVGTHPQPRLVHTHCQQQRPEGWTVAALHLHAGGRVLRAGLAGGVVPMELAAAKGEDGGLQRCTALEPAAAVQAQPGRNDDDDGDADGAVALAVAEAQTSDALGVDVEEVQEEVGERHEAQESSQGSRDQRAAADDGAVPRLVGGAAEAAEALVSHPQYAGSEVPPWLATDPWVVSAELDVRLYDGMLPLLGGDETREEEEVEEEIEVHEVQQQQAEAERFGGEALRSDDREVASAEDEVKTAMEEVKEEEADREVYLQPQDDVEEYEAVTKGGDVHQPKQGEDSTVMEEAADSRWAQPATTMEPSEAVPASPFAVGCMRRMVDPVTRSPPAAAAPAAAANTAAAAAAAQAAAAAAASSAGAQAGPSGITSLYFRNAGICLSAVVAATASALLLAGRPRNRLRSEWMAEWKSVWDVGPLPAVRRNNGVAAAAAAAATAAAAAGLAAVGLAVLPKGSAASENEGMYDAYGSADPFGYAARGDAAAPGLAGPYDGVHLQPTEYDEGYYNQHHQLPNHPNSPRRFARDVAPDLGLLDCYHLRSNRLVTRSPTRPADDGTGGSAGDGSPMGSPLAQTPSPPGISAVWYHWLRNRTIFCFNRQQMSPEARRLVDDMDQERQRRQREQSQQR